METVASKLCQTIPWRKATVSLDNKTLKCSLTVQFQSYPLASAEKERLATASAVFGNYDSTQSAMPIPVARNAEPIRWKAELIWQNIRFRNTKCIQSDCNILGLSVQGLVSHIINIHTCANMHTHANVHMHTHTHTHSAHKHTNKSMSPHTHTHTHTHLRVCTPAQCEWKFWRLSSV